METTQQLIHTLAQSPAPVRTSAPFALFLKWFAGSMAYVALVLCFMGVRDDIFYRLDFPLFLAEVLLLVAVIITTGISAVVLSYPDIYQKRALALLPLLPLVAFWDLLTLEWTYHYPHAMQTVHGADCLLCITFLSLLPGTMMLMILRRQASVHYYQAGALALVSASSIGCLTLRLSEKTDYVPHLVEWHYLPMIGFGIIGLVLGRKFLKW